MGLLDSMGEMSPQQLMQMLQMGQQDPFTRAMPGEDLLGMGGMSMPQMGQQQPQQDPNMQQAGMEQMPMGMESAMMPGLPNIPSNMSGFGFGQFAPKEVQPMGLKQQLIQQLMQSFMQNGGMGGGF